MIGLSTISFLLYFIYPISLIAISIYVSRNKEMTLNNYFFANRDIHWLIASISFLTSTLFGLYILGISSLELSGFPVVYGIISATVLIAAGWYLYPRFFQLKINTLPEYFEKRFNKTCRYLLSALYIFCNIFIRLIVILVASGFFFSTITGIDAYSSLLFILVITGVYLIIGGLHAEMYINIIQVLFITAVVAGFLFWLINQSNGANSILIKVTSLIRFDTVNNSQTSFAGTVIGLPVLGFWFWCGDQIIVQKIISIRNTRYIKRASLYSAAFQLLPVLIFILPGIVFIMLSQSFNETVLQRQFFDNLLPDILKGGIIIAVAAALMASLASLLNTTSMLITLDFYRSINPDASDRKLVLIGRMTVLLLMFWAIIITPLAQAMEFSLCIKLIKVFSYFASLIAAVFITSLLNRKINAVSALLSLCIGIVIILFRSVSEVFLQGHSYSLNILNLILEPDFLEFSAVIFLTTLSLLYIFNYLSRNEFLKSFIKKISLPHLRTNMGWNFHQIIFLVLSLIIMLVLAGIFFI